MRASRKQLALLNISVLKQRLIIAEGAFRTGKTLFLAWGFANLIIDQQENRPVFEGNRYAVAGQTNVSATFTNVVQRTVYWLTLRGYTCEKYHGWNYKCYKTTGEGEERRTVVFYIETFAINDSTSYERLQGGTYRSVFLDEGPLMSEDNIDNIMGRCATFDDHKVVMTGNPEGPTTHWFYKKFLKGNKQVYHIHFNMLDNPINSKETVNYYKDILSDSVYQKKVLGRWVATTGQCYPKLPDVRPLPQDLDEVMLGMDYGQVDATTVVAVGVKDDHYYIFGQYYHKNGEGEPKTLVEYKTDVARFVNPMTKVHKCPITLTVETSPSPVLPFLTRDYEIEQIVDIVPVDKSKVDPKSKSAIDERVQVINMLINMGRLHITDTNLPVYEAMSNAVYDDKKGVRLDNGTTDIDSLDGMEYAIKRDFTHIIYNVFSNAPVSVDVKKGLEDMWNAEGLS